MNNREAKLTARIDELMLHIRKLETALASQAQQPTDLSKQLREYAADSGYSHNDYADTMLAAADKIERLAASQAQQQTIEDLQEENAEMKGSNLELIEQVTIYDRLNEWYRSKNVDLMRQLELKAQLQSQAQQPDWLLKSTQDLAMHLWKTHYKAESPVFEVLNDLAGVISQIDNMTTGLVRLQSQTQQDQLRDTTKMMQGCKECDGQTYMHSPTGEYLGECPYCTKEQEPYAYDVPTEVGTELAYATYYTEYHNPLPDGAIPLYLQSQAQQPTKESVKKLRDLADQCKVAASCLTYNGARAEAVAKHLLLEASQTLRRSQAQQPPQENLEVAKRRLES